MRCGYCQWAIPVGVWLLLTFRAAAADAALLAEVRNGHQAAIDSIHTFSCRMTVSSFPPGDQTTPDTYYWRDADRGIRVRYRQSGSLIECLATETQIQTLRTSHDSANGAISPRIHR